MKKGLFISFEGMEGSGKTTHARMLALHLSKRAIECVLTAEPGGTEIGWKIRELLLDVEHRRMDAVTELLLYAASRRQHLVELILPALKGGKTVITDRFSDSTRAYQGAARGIDMGLIEEIDAIVTSGMKPDITFLLDLDPEAGLERNRRGGTRDRIELEEADFHRKVRQGFLDIQRAEPGRVRLVDAGRSIERTHEEIVGAVTPLLKEAEGWS